MIVFTGMNIYLHANEITKLKTNTSTYLTLKSKIGSQEISGYELPLADNEFENQNIKNFSPDADGKPHITRLITLNDYYFYRLHTSVPNNANESLKKNILLGLNGTWLTNLQFRTNKDGMNQLALLPEWYRAYAPKGPTEVSYIKLPKGTEIYIGYAAPQKSTSGDLSPMQKRKKGTKGIKEIISIPTVANGGGVQILVPPKHYITHQEQLTLNEVLGTWPIKTGE